MPELPEVDALPAGLTPGQVRLVCGVWFRQYKACVAGALVDAVAGLDVRPVPAQCGALWVRLQEQCAEHIRSGDLPTAPR